MLGRWGRRSRYPKDLRDAGRPDDPLFERPLVHGRIDSGVVAVRRPGSDEVEVYHVPAKRKGGPKVNAAEKPAFDPTTVLALLDRIEALESMLLRLYQDTVAPDTHYCHRCGINSGHDESCAMAELEELLRIEVEGNGEEEGGATDGR